MPIALQNKMNPKEAFEKTQSKLQISQISDTNKQLLIKFQEEFLDFKAENKDYRQIASIVSTLITILELLGKDADKIDKDDLTTLYRNIRQKTYCRTVIKRIKGDVVLCQSKPKQISEGTINVYKQRFKRFCAWLGKGALFAENQLRKAKRKPVKQHNFSDILRDEDIEKAIPACNYEMEKAFLAVLHESGARIQEHLAMRRKDIWKEDNIAKIRLFGKTGERVIPIVKSVPYIFRWLDIHPHKDKEAFVWISQANFSRHLPIAYMGARQMIRRIFARAGLNKINKPHWFRHSRASLNAAWMNEAQLCLFMGWYIGSAVARTYCHMDSSAVTDTVKQHFKLATADDKTEIPKVCASCDNINTPASDFCSKCGTPLTLKTAVTSEQLFKKELKETMSKFMDIVKDKERFAEFQKYLETNKSTNEEATK